MARTSSAASEKSLYGVHPGVATMQKWVSELKEKTGRSLEEWIALVKKDGPAEEASRREWLKTKHKMGTNSAWWVAERAAGKGGEDSSPEEYLAAAVRWVEEQYSGKKAALRPVYDALLELALKQGPDTKACPCKTIVPLCRKNVFAQIKPTTNTRLDLGLFLRGQRAPRRLIPTGGEAKGDRITHRIKITSTAGIDDEV